MLLIFLCMQFLFVNFIPKYLNFTKFINYFSLCCDFVLHFIDHSQCLLLDNIHIHNFLQISEVVGTKVNKSMSYTYNYL